MDEKLALSTNEFAEIWRRVNDDTSSGSCPTEEAMLSSLIEQSAHSAAFSSSLAKMFPNPGRTVLQTQAAEARNRLRNLRAEYFLLTGESFSPKSACPGVSGKLASLRELYFMQQKNAAAFYSAAETASPERAELFHQYAEELECSAKDTRRLLTECF